MNKRWRMADSGWRMGQRGRSLTIITARCLLLAALLFTSGCGEGYLAHMIHGPDKVPAAYTLADRPTLIVVDDPAGRFQDPNLPAVVAVNIEFNIKQNKALEAPIVPARELADMQSKLGDEYARLPIDELGRRLGAEQVIYALIDDVTLQSTSGMYRPTALAQVKVIDATTGKRLFPEAPAVIDPNASTRGRNVVAQFRGGTSVGADSQGAAVAMRRELAEMLGRDIARLFFKWKPPEIGSRFEER
ncbi:MAG: hypothetical protein IT445_11480 [Phycisphaeraceae bacterium]|nr:hypothetical protein [Phycisphaeraceae bacterium]